MILHRFFRASAAALALALLLPMPARSTSSAPKAATKAPAPAAGASGARKVVINKTRLADKQVAALEQSFHVRVLDGAYWYDKECGAWGLEGGPTQGFVPAGLKVGGAMRADASGAGRTGVFVNGRELHPICVGVPAEASAGCSTNSAFPPRGEPPHSDRAVRGSRVPRTSAGACQGGGGRPGGWCGSALVGLVPGSAFSARRARNGPTRSPSWASCRNRLSELTVYRVRRPVRVRVR